MGVVKKGRGETYKWVWFYISQAGIDIRVYRIYIRIYYIIQIYNIFLYTLLSMRPASPGRGRSEWVAARRAAGFNGCGDDVMQ